MVLGVLGGQNFVDWGGEPPPGAQRPGGEITRLFSDSVGHGTHVLSAIVGI
jgi:hypothetical protein